MDIDSDDSQEYDDNEDLVTWIQQPTPLMGVEVVEENSVEHEQ
jgi:hypothetical protein